MKALLPLTTTTHYAFRKPFDIILVHSFSRFARDELTFKMSKVKLRRSGVLIQSISQPLSNDSNGDLMESILTSFDAYTSAEIAKHTARGMKENARQGFSNGSRPPFGYHSVEAEKRGEKIKKKLAIEEDEAKVVKRIFGLYRGVTGQQFGVKAIAAKLNGEGVEFRGKPFMISSIHRILTSETYTGVLWFNVRDAKNGATRAASEWIKVAVPAIVPRDEWQAVQFQLAERAPAKIAARVVKQSDIVNGHSHMRLVRSLNCSAWWKPA